jgi:2-polyprenyl-3-methyl-5-hydroxy-6-metoxy-1,4-benzoquinol methylase
MDDKYVSDFCKKTIYNYIFKDMDLNNIKVLDLGFGTGRVTRYLKKKYNNIDVYGFDISNKLVENYNKYFHGKGSVVDIASNDYSKIIENYRGFFDCVIALGIIHHCHNNLQVAINNITYLVKKNGTLITYDPNKKYILNPIREIWYKYDKNIFHQWKKRP